MSKPITLIVGALDAPRLPGVAEGEQIVRIPDVLTSPIDALSPAQADQLTKLIYNCPRSLLVEPCSAVQLEEHIMAPLTWCHHFLPMLKNQRGELLIHCKPHHGVHSQSRVIWDVLHSTLQGWVRNLRREQMGIVKVRFVD